MFDVTPRVTLHGEGVLRKLGFQLSPISRKYSPAASGEMRSVLHIRNAVRTTHKDRRTL